MPSLRVMKNYEEYIEQVSSGNTIIITIIYFLGVYCKHSIIFFKFQFISKLAICFNRRKKKTGSCYVSGKLPTYPSPKPTLRLSSYLGQNVRLGEG